MNPKPPSRFIRKNASLVLTTVFGALSFRIIVLMAILLLSFDLFSSAVSGFFDCLSTNLRLGKVLQLSLFPVLLLILWLCARKTMRRVVTHIHEVEGPRKVKTLVMFLSPLERTKDPEREKTLIDKLIEQGGRIDDVTLRKEFQGPWRMPLEAIAYHLPPLQTVIVIPSEDTESQVPVFRHLIRTITTGCRSDNDDPVEVLTLRDLGESFPAYANFESARNQDDVLNQLLNHLSDQPGYQPEDLIIDITGGQKISSIAGAVVALGRDRRIEYVSTGDYKVREYDITVEAEDVKY